MATALTVLLRLAEPGAAARDVNLAASAAHVEEALESAGFSATFMAGWTLGVLLFASLFGIGASILLFRGDRSNPVAALLALLPLASATVQYSLLPIAIVNLTVTVSLVLLPITLLAFPDGRFPNRISLALLGANLLWAVMAWWDPILHSQGALVLLAASATAVVLRLRRTASADQRQQLRWAMLGFAGSGLCALGLLACLQLQYLRDDLWLCDRQRYGLRPLRPRSTRSACGAD